MKKMKNFIIIMLVLLASQKSIGQDKITKVSASQTILVSDIKTTHLIFSEPITYVDLGSPYFIADTVKTLIKLRHIGEDTTKDIGAKTNLTVITKDGAFYSIPLLYNRDNEDLTYRIESSSEYIEKAVSDATEEELRKNEVQRLGDQLTFAKPNVNIVNTKDDFDIIVNGIYYEKDLIALRVVLKNASAIDIDIDDILFRLKLKPRISPDFIYQERIIKPLHVLNPIKKLKGYSTNIAIFVFNKFTPNKNEVLTIDVLEKNGGRSAKIKVPRNKLMNPKSF